MAKDQDLFGMTSSGTRKDGSSSAQGDNRIAVAAHRLTIMFTEEPDLPARLRKSSSNKSKRFKEDSIAEINFKANVKSWTWLIETMLTKINHPQAWRFIGLAPEVDATIQKLTDCKDFCDLVDYLTLRRDKEKCGLDELGGLAMLSVAFQHEIEKRIKPL